MSKAALQKDDWTLRETTQGDIDELMAWFPTAQDICDWGSPAFRFPFTRTTFLEDMRWGHMDSYCLRDSGGGVAAFGQLYDRDGRIHLARLVVNPTRRGRGIGRRLIEMLMAEGQSRWPGEEFSLFVLHGNIPAYECYRSMGFVVREYPKDMPYAELCHFMTRPVRR